MTRQYIYSRFKPLPWRFTDAIDSSVVASLTAGCFWNHEQFTKMPTLLIGNRGGSICRCAGQSSIRAKAGRRRGRGQRIGLLGNTICNGVAVEGWRGRAVCTVVRGMADGTTRAADSMADGPTRAAGSIIRCRCPCGKCLRTSRPSPPSLSGKALRPREFSQPGMPSALGRAQGYF